MLVEAGRKAVDRLQWRADTECCACSVHCTPVHLLQSSSTSSGAGAAECVLLADAASCGCSAHISRVQSVGPVAQVNVHHFFDSSGFIHPHNLHTSINHILSHTDVCV